MPDNGILVANTDVTLLQELLSEAGFEATTCLTDGDTYSLIKQRQPSLVILDVGLQASAADWPLLKLLHFDPRTKDIPVLVTSVDHQFVESKTEFLQQHGYDDLELPATFEELVAKVIEMMKLHDPVRA